MERISAPFRVAAAALELWWRNWVTLAAVNLALALCWLSIVLGPPATLAAYSVAANLARGEDGDVRDFLQVLRAQFLLAWGWFLVSLTVSLLLAASLVFYAQLDTLWGAGLWALTASLGVLWLAVLFYAPPFLLADQRRNLLRAYRNALFTALASPLYTLVLLAMAALVAAISAGLVALLFLGGPCLIAVLASAAVQDRLKTYGVADRG